MEKKIEKYEILAIGTGNVVEGNVAKAKETAISNALVKGVEEYLALRLGSQGMMTNFPKLIHDVIPKARDVIENFNILAEEQIDGHYKLLVRLKINEKVMEERFRELGIILTEGPPITILFLVSQHEPLKSEVFYWWKEPHSEAGLAPTDLALYRIFQGHGFSPINRGLRIPEEQYSSGMKELNLSDVDAIRWGEAFTADVVIKGSSEIDEEKEVIVRLTALDIDKGVLIYQDSQTERIDKSPDRTGQIMKALERAIKKLATRMTPLIISAFQVREVQFNQLEIALKGVTNFKQFREFKEFLIKDIKGVKSVRQTRVKANSMSILIEFSGDKEKFLGMVSEHENFPFEADISTTEEGEIIFIIR